MCGDKIVVSDVKEENWFINLTVNGQEALIAPVQPYRLQSKKLKLINEYTRLAMKGEIAKAFEAYKKLEPMRRALLSMMVPGKTQAVQIPTGGARGPLPFGLIGTPPPLGRRSGGYGCIELS